MSKSWFLSIITLPIFSLVIGYYVGYNMEFDSQIQIPFSQIDNQANCILTFVEENFYGVAIDSVIGPDGDVHEKNEVGIFTIPCSKNGAEALVRGVYLRDGPLSNSGVGEPFLGSLYLALNHESPAIVDFSSIRPIR